MKLLNINITKTIKRNAIMIASAFFAFLLIFNLILYYVVTYQLTSVLDAKISHEIEHIESAFKIVNDSLVIVRPSEFDEADLVLLNDNPFFLQIYSPAGQIYLQSKNLKIFGPVPLSFPEFIEFEFFENTSTEKELVRTGYKKLFSDNGLQIGYMQLSTRRLRIVEVTKNIFYYNILLLPFVFVIIVSISIIISKKTFQPINNIIEIADKITVSNLKERLTLDTDPNDELSKLKTTLNNLFARLENQILQISSFSDNASHQLLTPLTIIKAELDGLTSSEKLNSTASESATIIKDQTDRMTKIINSLLILARADKARLKSNFVFNLSNSIAELQLNVTNYFRVNFEIEEGIYLKGNIEHFNIALGNIIENALKYSGESSVKVTATNANYLCRIKVYDNGIGIDDKEKDKVFDRFYRSSNAEDLFIKGYGLGLSLAKSIINSMGGEISIENNHPQGSIFTIELKSVRLD